MSREPSQRAAFEIAYALNQSHVTGAPIHEITRALLGNASDFGDIADAFVEIVAPIIEAEIQPDIALPSANCLHNDLARSGIANPVWFCKKCDANFNLLAIQRTNE